MKIKQRGDKLAFVIKKITGEAKNLYIDNDDHLWTLKVVQSIMIIAKN